MSESISPLLEQNGLNMLAIFNIKSLPTEMINAIRTDVGDISAFKQLLVFGHGGKDMWQAVQQSPFANTQDPIDSFSVDVVQRYFAQELSSFSYKQLYPGCKQSIPLRTLGDLAGWHKPSPFRVGINEKFGSWFAYRVVVLADTKLSPTEKMDWANPCDSCEDKPCISVCPANALEQGDLSLKTCINYRLEEESLCKSKCLSRLSCPIAKEHRYTKEQIKYNYGLSMDVIKTLPEYN